MSQGIYRIENILNRKVYIGSSLDIERRFKQHKQDLKENRHHSYKLQNDFNKYGNFDNFAFEIIEQTECSRTELLVIEQYYIDRYNAYETGYNCCKYSINQKYTKRNLCVSKNELSNDISVFIPETIIKNKNLSNYSIAVYCVLHSLCIPTQLFHQCVTQQQIEFYLTGDISGRRRLTDYIRCGLNELIDNNIITKEKEIQKHYILDCSNMWIDTTTVKFTTITFQEVYKIFQIPNINNFLLLRYFIILMGTISSKITVYLSHGDSKNRVVGNVSIEYLSNLSGVSERTIIEYNKLLEENKLLYVYRQKDFILDEEIGIKSLSNIYGRVCDMEYINRYALKQKDHKQSYKYVKSNNEKANNKRRLAQMYVQILKSKDFKYSKDDILEVYNYVISENEKYEKLYEKNQYEDYLEKIRDISVFKKYDFIEM